MFPASRANCGYRPTTLTPRWLCLHAQIFHSTAFLNRWKLQHLCIQIPENVEQKVHFDSQPDKYLKNETWLTSEYVTSKSENATFWVSEQDRVGSKHFQISRYSPSWRLWHILFFLKTTWKSSESSHRVLSRINNHLNKWAFCFCCHVLRD